jgi:hypothetical protein
MMSLLPKCDSVTAALRFCRRATIIGDAAVYWIGPGFQQAIRMAVVPDPCGESGQVDDIGPIRAASILSAWAEQKAVREIMVFSSRKRAQL